MNDLNKIIPFYSKWYSFLVLITVSSIIIGLTFSLAFNKDFTFFNILLPSLINTAILWGGSMTIVKFVWLKFPWEQKPLTHLFIEIALISLLLIIYILAAGATVSYFNSVIMTEALQIHYIDIIITVLITFLIVTIHEAIFFYKQWKFNFSKSLLLEKDNIEAQYNALKAQVNPHFLFNSLNSLINMLDEHPVAEKYVQDLSDYLRYVLVSNTRETVSLSEELENSKKYIHLQKQRFGDNFDIDITIDSAVFEKHIPPLAVQMLLENCFNHNIISKSKPLHIKVYNTENSLTVENNLQKKQNPDSTGQGLKNIEGRYRFTSGEAVKVESNENIFRVTIPLISKA